MVIMGQFRDYIVHDATQIKGFFGEYRWLSNYHLVDIMYEGINYPSTEHAYQAAKTINVTTRQEFLGLTCKEARLKGQEIDKREDWEFIKFQIMNDVLEIKFSNSELRDKLLATRTKHLEETNHWGDITYGVCDGEGKNMLGRLLMLIRLQLIIDKLKYEI